jgi:hypothetical protein
MKNKRTASGSFEKINVIRMIKKEKITDKKNQTLHRQKEREDQYEDYFNARYGNKLYK